MTELAMRDDRTDLTPHTEPAAAPPMSDLLLWAHEARQAAQIATSLARTSFVPATLRGKPEDITAAILAGQELGLRPMASLRSMDIIQGTPALRAHAMRGLVQSHGHSVQLVSASPDRVVMRGRRAGEAEWQAVEWTIERAAQLGLTGKAEWKKQPQTMLQARATGEICRLIASDVLHAMPYAAEELDGDPVAASPSATAPVTAAEITGRARPRDDRYDDQEEPAPDRMTQKQQRMMHALFRRVDITERADRMQYVNEVLAQAFGPDRQVESSNELTVDEAGRVIDKLQAWAVQLEPAGGDG